MKNRKEKIKPTEETVEEKADTQVGSQRREQRDSQEEGQIDSQSCLENDDLSDQDKSNVLQEYPEIEGLESEVRDVMTESFSCVLKIIDASQKSFEVEFLKLSLAQKTKKLSPKASAEECQRFCSAPVEEMIGLVGIMQTQGIQAAYHSEPVAKSVVIRMLTTQCYLISVLDYYGKRNFAAGLPIYNVEDQESLTYACAINYICKVDNLLKICHCACNLELLTKKTLRAAENLKKLSFSCAKAMERSVCVSKEAIRAEKTEVLRRISEIAFAPDVRKETCAALR